MKVFKINGENSGVLNQLNHQHPGTILFYHPHCSHCNAMKPDWEKMKEILKQKNCNLYEVDGQYMDNIHHPMKQTVDGFPKIFNVNTGKLNAFEKERNMENMKNMKVMTIMTIMKFMTLMDFQKFDKLSKFGQNLKSWKTFPC